MRLPYWSIQQKIILLILVICLLPALIFLHLIGQGSRKTFEDTLGSELIQRTNDYARRFDNYFQDQMDQMRLMAREHERDLPGLAGQPGMQHQFEALIVISDSNQIDIYPAAGNEDKPLIKPLSEKKGVFATWWERRNKIPESGLFTDFRVRDPETSKLKTLGAFVFKGSDDRLYLFVCDANHLIDQFRGYLPGVPDVFLIYSSEQDQVIYSAQGPSGQLLGSIEETMHEESLGNPWFSARAGKEAKLYTVAEPQTMTTLRAKAGVGSVWSILLQYDMESFLGPQDALFWRSTLIALVVVLAMLGLAAVGVRQLIKPLRALKEQANKLAAGNLNVRARVRSRDEIGDVADAFNLMAMHLRQSYQALEERVEENHLRAEHIHTINEITNAIIQSFSLDEIFEILNKDLLKILKFDAMWLAIFDRDRSDLRVTQINPAGLIGLFNQGKIPSRRSLHAHVIHSRETIHAEIGPGHNAEYFESRILRAEGFQSYLIAPLISRDGIIGTLTVASTAPESYNHELAEIMTSLANPVTIAMEQAALFQRLSQFASELERKVEQRSEELAAANQKLLQTEKYFATGRMAGNLAHEINNPLGIIKNYLQIVKNNLIDAGGGRRRTDPNLQHLEIINDEVNRIARLVRQMLDLHRPVEQKVQPVNINNLIEDILSLMNDELRQGRIEPSCKLDPELPCPVASPDLIRQVLINLIRNAQDAMEDGGTLVIETKQVMDWEGTTHLPTARITISDNGCGIAGDHLSQIFDPFFSTKSPEKGTGLGLCVSYSIVRMYHGSIDVESEPGRGTTLIVTLPAEERKANVVSSQAQGGC